MKKIIIYLLISSMINLIGCYYQEQLSPSTYDFEEHSDIQITTSDTTYKLKGDDYHFTNDTVFATLSKKIDKQSTLKYDVKVPINNIKTIEVERTDALGTVGVIFGVLVGLFGILVIAVAASMAS